jgi:hypothetical protein
MDKKKWKEQVLFATKVSYFLKMIYKWKETYKTGKVHRYYNIIAVEVTEVGLHKDKIRITKKIKKMDEKALDSLAHLIIKDISYRYMTQGFPKNWKM